MTDKMREAHRRKYFGYLKEWAKASGRGSDDLHNRAKGWLATASGGEYRSTTEIDTEWWVRLIGWVRNQAEGDGAKISRRKSAGRPKDVAVLTTGNQRRLIERYNDFLARNLLDHTPVAVPGHTDVATETIKRLYKDLRRFIYKNRNTRPNLICAQLAGSLLSFDEYAANVLRKGAAGNWLSPLELIVAAELAEKYLWGRRKRGSQWKS